jgi:excisionase family DNA binding protein
MQDSIHRLLTVAEAGAELRIGRNGVTAMIRRGELAAVRLGSGPRAPFRIPAHEVRRILAPVEQPDSGKAVQ